MPGVVAVFTADDLRIAPQAPSGNVEGASGTLEGPFAREVVARDTVRYVGEPVAVVIADSLAHGQDAAEVVWPAVDALDAVTDVEAAFADGAPLLFPAHVSNIAHSFEQNWDADALVGADVIARARIVQQRVAPVPMETNAIAVVPEDGGGYTIWCSTQVPFDVRSDLAELLEVDKKQVADRGARRGRRLRREAHRLPRVRGRRRRGQGARASGPMGRDAIGEHAEPEPRPGAGAARRDRRETGRERGGHARGAARRHGRVSGRGVPPHDHAGDARGRLHDPRDRLTWLERGHERHAGQRHIAARADRRRRRWSSARWT